MFNMLTTFDKTHITESSRRNAYSRVCIYIEGGHCPFCGEGLYVMLNVSLNSYIDVLS